MIIQHNIMAINAHRQLTINNSKLSGNLEKLSSGYRINRAADDAAGLAISEKMRAQITGLNRASMNAQDGASLIQTAEGALAEVHSMLNRMVELATQSANGTIQASDRQKIEAETQALKEEIDRISKATNFNGIQLLDGSLSKITPRDIVVKGIKVNETAAVAGSYEFQSIAGVASGTGPTAWGDTNRVEYTVALNNGDSFTASFRLSDDKTRLISNSDNTVYVLSGTDGTVTSQEIASALESEFRKTNLNNDFIISLNTAGDGLVFQNRVAGTQPPQIKSLSQSISSRLPTAIDADPGKDPVDGIKSIRSSSFTVFDANPATNVTNEDIATFEINGNKFILVDRAKLATGTPAGDDYKKYVQQLENRGVNIISVDTSNWTTALNQVAGEINQKTGLDLTYRNNNGHELVLRAPEGQGNGLTMQVGDTSADYNKVTVSVDDMSSSGLGIQNISMASQESASRALDRINAAIEKVSVNRGNLGALQNRLTYTINNLGVTSENMTAAESRIRDVDMAKEMMQFTKNNVLAQAAQSMLAQANMQPQQILQLLR